MTTTLRRFLDAQAPRLTELYPRARDVLRGLAAHRLGVSPAHLIAHPDRRLDEAERARLDADVAALAAGMPLAWCYGDQPFMDWDFATDARALTPRPETEALTARVVAAYRDQAPPRRILDLCCGSGVMGLALALSFPAARVDLTDLSPDALALCRENASRHGLHDRVRILEGDLWDAVPDETTYDLVVANPPYVAEGEPVEPGVLAHEPHLALFSDDAGMAHIKRILPALTARLHTPGMAAFELGHHHQALLQPWLAARPEAAGYRFEADPFGVSRYLIYTQ